MVYLACDHAGYELKEKIKQFLTKAGYLVEDFGAYTLNPEDDYPDFISKAAEAVSKNLEDKAIILGGSGQGEAIVANKFPNVRAAVYYGGSTQMSSLTRQHNDANVLSLGARFLTEDEAIATVKLFLETQFTNEERHARRIEKIKHLEREITDKSQ